jgi:hypothetical protein
VTLYNLFKDLDKTHAMLMVIFVSVSVAIGVVNLINQIAPLVLLSGAEFLSVFTKPQSRRAVFATMPDPVAAGDRQLLSRQLLSPQVTTNQPSMVQD